MTEEGACLAREDAIPSTPAHAQLYHVQCGKCRAMTVRDVSRDSVRMICPSCSRRLTLPATISAVCPGCQAEREYPHFLAGHSTACTACGRPVLLGPVAGRTESRSRSVRHGYTHEPQVSHTRRKRQKRTLAFSEGAERSLVLIVAAIATLIFIVVASLRS